MVDLGLAEGDFLTGWQVRFGEVAADMHSGVEFGDAYNWRFLAEATRALTPADGTLENNCTVYTERVVDADTTIFDEDADAVVTHLVAVEKVGRASDGAYRGSITGDPSRLPATADAAALRIIAAALLAAGFGVFALIARRRAGRGPVHVLPFLLVGALALVPSLAFADEERATTTRTYTWMVGEAAPEVPQTITIDGAEWTLAGVTEACEDPAFVPETKIVTATDQGVFATLEEAQAAFPETIAYEADGFSGTLARTQFDYEGRYAAQDRMFDVTRSYGPFATNDSIAVPKRTAVTITDAQGAREAVLPCVDYAWELRGTDALGFPTGWTVTCTYRGVVTVFEDAGCSVQVTYEGQVASTARRMVVTATYLAPAAAPAPFRLPSGVVPGSAAVALAVGILVFFRTRNVTVCRPGDEAVVARVHARRDARGVLAVPLPGRLPLQRGAVLLFRATLCDGGPFLARQGGVTVYSGIVEPRVVIPAPAEPLELAPVADGAREAAPELVDVG